MADVIPDKLPMKYLKRPPAPQKQKTIDEMKPDETVRINPSALLIDRDSGGWLDPSTPILEEGAVAPYLVVRNRSLIPPGYVVDVKHGGRKWECAENMTTAGLKPVVKFDDL